MSATLLDRLAALVPGVAVLLAGLAGHDLVSGAARWPLAVLLVLALGVAWVLFLTPWSRHRLPRLTRAVAGAGLAIGVALALTMTGHFGWAALCVAVAAFLALAPVLVDRAEDDW